jgi:hypothetical protein
MKTYIIILFIYCSNSILAQKPLDTIYANDKKNVALFFPEPIRQGITGSENFVFTYNREKEQYFGLLQAKPGAESNLLVISNTGSIFSYIVRYKEQLSQLNYFIPESKRIGNEKSLSKLPKKEIEKEKRFNKKRNNYQRFCSYLVSKKKQIRRLKKKREGITLSIENIVFDKEELYFVIEIVNNSSLDYDLNFLNLTIQTRKKGKKKSLQSIYQEPVFKYKLPLKIKEKETKKLVYVLPKFSISDQRLVVLQLDENNGERNVKLKISKKFINNPN